MYFPSVAIFLCTHQGEAFLHQQLDSILGQTHTNFKIYVSDDGSTDSTMAILKKYQKLLGTHRFFITMGPQKSQSSAGASFNFLTLLMKHKDLEADYFSFSDQDDIWKSDKLARSIDKLAHISKHIPALYSSCTRLIDMHNKKMNISHCYTKNPNFQNALVQCIGGGNTMLFNKGTMNLLCQAQQTEVVSHDWWTYLLVSGASGYVYHDTYPSLFYRQHENNISGENSSLKAKLARMSLLMDGVFHTWNTVHIGLLKDCIYLLDEKNKKILTQWEQAREKTFISRVIGVFLSGVYRQTLIENIGLWIATIFKKV